MCCADDDVQMMLIKLNRTLVLKKDTCLETFISSKSYPSPIGTALPFIVVTYELITLTVKQT